MYKRIKVIAVILIISLFSLGGRLFYLSYFDTAAVQSRKNSGTETYGTNRGLILDCRLKPLVETEQSLIHSKINTAMSFSVPVRYAANQLCPHIIGYTDADNIGVVGIEKDYNNYLKAIPNTITVTTYKDAKGRELLGKGTQVNTEKQCKDSGIALCIDSRIQEIVQKAGEQLKTGAIVVMRADSAEIAGISSFPLFSPNALEKEMKDTNQPLLNRALQNYNVGSVFKVVVCLAALEKGISTAFTYRCTGETKCGGITFHCHKEQGHGILNMEQALAASCNPYFIHLAQRTGYEKIVEICKRLHLEEAIHLSDSIQAAGGNLPAEKNLVSPAALANFSFGQGELLATPVWLCNLYCTIYNGGYYMQPKLVKGKVLNGVCQTQEQNKTAVFGSSHAQTLTRMLQYAVEKGTGRGAYLENLIVGGKTATAQTGLFTGNQEKLISYFIGMYTTKGEKYTVLVMRENGTSGSADCVPIFKEICHEICALKD